MDPRDIPSLRASGGSVFNTKTAKNTKITKTPCIPTRRRRLLDPLVAFVFLVVFVFEITSGR